MSDVCCSRYLNLSCSNPDTAPRSSSYVSPEVYLGLLAAPVALLIWFGRYLHPPPPPPPAPSDWEQPPDGGSDKIPKTAIAEDPGKSDDAAAISSSVPLPAEPYHSGGRDDEGYRGEEGAAAPRFRYPPIRYREVEGDGDHLFDPDSNPDTIYNWVRGPPNAASTDGTFGRYDAASTDGTFGRSHGVPADEMASALRGTRLDVHSCDESTIHPANDVLIDALPYACTNAETLAMFDFWVSKLEDDAGRIFQGEAGRRNIFLLNNIYSLWQTMRRQGASFSNVELVSMLITMIQRCRRSYMDVCWAPLSKYHRSLTKFTAEFLIITSQQMTWKVTAELKYNLRQEIVDFVVPPYEASLLAIQAKRRLLGVLFPVKGVILGKKKQRKYTGEELENVIRGLFEGGPAI